MSFRPDQVRRYARHVLLPDVGGRGQARLLDAAVVVDVGGAAGRIAATYLVAAGVGAVYLDGPLDAPVDAPAFPLTLADRGARLGAALVAVLTARNPDVRVAPGPAPAGCPRLAVVEGAPGLAAAFAGGAAAAARWLHEVATGGAP